MNRNLVLIVLIIFSKNGFAQNYSWGKSYGGTVIEASAGLQIDSNDNIFHFGFFSGTADFDPSADVSSFTSLGQSDIFISKFAEDGSWIWTKTIGGTGLDEASDLAIDSEGNLILFGVFNGTVDFDPGAGVDESTSTGGRDCFVLKLNNDGDYIWSGTFGSTSHEVAEHITTDSNNDIIFTGKFLNLVDFDPSAGTQTIDAGNTLYSRYFVKWSNTGSYLWSSSIADPDVQVNDMLADASNNILFAGFFTGTVDIYPGPTTFNLLTTSPTSFESDGFLLMLNSSGSPVWAKDYGTSAYDYLYAIALNQAGDIILGCETETATLMKVNPSNGNVIWSKLFGGRIYDLVLDSNEQIFLSSVFYEVEDFDPSSYVVSHETSGSNNALMMKLTANGDYLWSGAYSSTLDAKAFEIEKLANDEIIMAGTFMEVIDLDPSASIAEFTSVGNIDIFLTKLSQCASPTQVGIIEGNISPCIPDTLTYSLTNIDETTTASWLTSHQNTSLVYDDTLTNDLFISTIQPFTISARPYNSCGVGPIATLTVTGTATPNISIEATPNDTICFENLVNLDALVTSSVSFTWSDGITDDTYFQPTESGYYTVTAIGAGGCSRADSIYIHVVPEFDIAVQVEPEATYYCEGQELTFTASGAEYYSYTDGVQDGVPFVPNTDLFLVTGYIGICTATQYVSIDILPLPVLEVILTPNEPVCEGQPVNILITGADTFEFVPQHINGTDVTLTETTNFTVNGSIAGCGTDLEFTVEVIPQPEFTTQPTNQTTTTGTTITFSVQATDASTYTWQVNTGEGFTNITAGAQYANPNTATLTVSNPTLAMNGYDYRCVISNDGCDATSNSANLTVNSSNGVNDISAGGLALVAYPNPTHADCQLVISEQLMGKTLIIHDITGKLITEQIIQNTHLILPTSLWESGMYYMSVNGMTERVKLVVGR